MISTAPMCHKFEFGFMKATGTGLGGQSGVTGAAIGSYDFDPRSRCSPADVRGMLREELRLLFAIASGRDGADFKTTRRTSLGRKEAL